MTNIEILDSKGKKKGILRLKAKISSIKIKPSLVHFVVANKLSTQRRSTAHTKTRKEVRGGGRKPWPQKGTGRARAGSIRSPLWKGGGVIFGPRKTKNYFKKINKKILHQAFNMVLKDKIDNKNIVILEDFNSKVKKTKDFVDILKNLPVWQKKTLLVLPQEDEKLFRVARNISFLRVSRVNHLSILDLLKCKYLLTDKKTFERILEKV